MKIRRFLILCMLTLMLPHASRASEETLPSSRGLVVLMHGSVLIDTPMEGDVIAIGNTISIQAPIDGDLFAVGRSIVVNAPVTGSIRAIGNTILINRQVGKNITIIGTGVNLGKSSQIDGHATVFGNLLELDGTIKKTLSARGRIVRMNGKLFDTGNISGSNITIGRRATVRAPLHVAAPKRPRISSSVIGEENITYRYGQPSFLAGETKRSLFARWLLSFLLSVIVGISLIFLWPHRVPQITIQMRRHALPSILLGMLIISITPIVLLMLMLTIIGIPLAMLLGIFSVAMMFIGRIFAGLALGQLLIDHPKLRTERERLFVQLLCGAFLLSMSTSLPWIGWLLSLGAMMWGLGGIALHFIHLPSPPQPTRRR